MTDIWKEQYESFTEQWGYVVEGGNQIETSECEPDDTIQIFRMQKLIAHLDDVIQSIDPQLLSKDKLQDLCDKSKDCHSDIDSGDFDGANKALDYIANHLGAFHLVSITKTESMQKFAGQLRKNSTVVEQITSESYSKFKNLLEKTESKDEKIDAIFEKISQYSDKLFKDDEEDEEIESIETKISNMEAEAEDRANKIEAMHKKLTNWEDEDETVVECITALHESITDEISSAEEKLKALMNYYTSIYGKKNEQGKFEGGLKQEIEARRKALDEFNVEHGETIDSLEKRIERLLPGATSAALASAYKERKDEAHENEILFSNRFIGCVGVWFLLGGGLFIYASFFLGLENWNVLLKNMLAALSVFVPLALLTGFFSKRRSEQHRLKQEYAHKEALATSYDSFKQQVDALAGDEKEKEVLLNHLMKTMIDAIGFNAAKTLDKKHGDDIPSKNLLQRIAEKME